MSDLTSWIVNCIKDNIGGRELVLYWKDDILESAIVVLAGSQADIKKQNIAWMRNGICNYDNEYLQLPEEYRKFTEQ